MYLLRCLLQQGPSCESFACVASVLVAILKWAPTIFLWNATADGILLRGSDRHLLEMSRHSWDTRASAPRLGVGIGKPPEVNGRMVSFESPVELSLPSRLAIEIGRNTKLRCSLSNT